MTGLPRAIIERSNPYSVRTVRGILRSVTNCTLSCGHVVVRLWGRCRVWTVCPSCKADAQVAQEYQPGSDFEFMKDIVREKVS